MKVRRNARLLGSLVALAFAATLQAADPGPTFTAVQLREDLIGIRAALRDMPPDLSHSTDVPALGRALDELDTTLAASPAVTRAGAWRLFATLNPVLADGHLFIGFVDWRGDTRAHLANGGTLFPFEMKVGANCALHIRAQLGGGETPLSGQTVVEINGVPASDICEQMLARVHGDTRAFRADLASRRFWFFYWKLFGATQKYRLDLGFKVALEEPGSAALPEQLVIEASFERQFRLRLLPNRAALLTLGSFALPDKQPLLDFTHAAFAKLLAADTRTLVIDLRDNGGGDDVMWIEGVMPYLATRKFRTGTTYRKRVVASDPAKGEVAGSIVDGEIDSWFAPQPGNPLGFKGKTYVLVGPGTYSSAVLFANVMRDFAFGTVIGSGGSVRADQSGGARRTTLTNTGLIVVAPRFVLHRPSAKTQPTYLEPDIAMDDAMPAEDIARRLAR